MLIEDGILRGYMQDRLNARLMSVAPTGNGRRESFAHLPMPRMTNTIMLAGDRDPAEIIASVKNGLYAANFGGGQVDITSGKFVFSAAEAWMIEDGKLTYPVKGATLIGNGPDALTRVSMVGNDLALDAGVGTCGKDGQSVPVGVGQPTLRIDGLTVGGTGADALPGYCAVERVVFPRSLLAVRGRHRARSDRWRRLWSLASSGQLLVAGCAQCSGPRLPRQRPRTRRRVMHTMPPSRRRAHEDVGGDRRAARRCRRPSRRARSRSASRGRRSPSHDLVEPERELACRRRRAAPTRRAPRRSRRARAPPGWTQTMSSSSAHVAIIASMSLRLERLVERERGVLRRRVDRRRASLWPWRCQTSVASKVAAGCTAGMRGAREIVDRSTASARACT